jgi:hypothetical protein
LFCLAQRWYEHCRQNGYNGDYNQQFNERESIPTPVVQETSIRCVHVLSVVRAQITPPHELMLNANSQNPGCSACQVQPRPLLLAMHKIPHVSADLGIDP